jgi:fused signal recognition particle receptor
MGLFKKILKKFSGTADIDWDELEETLVAGDLGIHLTTRIVDQLRDRGRKLKGQDIVEVTREAIAEIFGDDAPALTPRADGKPCVILVAGVNGTGKTTSTAKLAHHLKSQGHSVLLAAADTFRAAAIEQLETWAGRLDLPMVKTQYQADPSSVCFEAHKKAISDGTEFLICDTAGRLHTRHNLMEELGKIRRTIAKQDESAPHEALLVVDATTGSNALNQAREFHKVLELSGVIVTKLDGSGKGGCAVSIKDELGIPTRFIGTGETATDFAAFNRDSFIENIL